MQVWHFFFLFGFMFKLVLMSGGIAQNFLVMFYRDGWSMRQIMIFSHKFAFSAEMRPAELFFQMHLLAMQSKAGSDSSSSMRVEFCQSPQKWVLRAIHTNPSCLRYWNVLQKLTD